MVDYWNGEYRCHLCLEKYRNFCISAPCLILVELDTCTRKRPLTRRPKVMSAKAVPNDPWGLNFTGEWDLLVEIALAISYQQHSTLYSLVRTNCPQECTWTRLTSNQSELTARLRRYSGTIHRTLNSQDATQKIHDQTDVRTSSLCARQRN